MPLPNQAHGWLVSMGQRGPLGRSIDDLQLVWEIILGPDASDFEIAPIAWRPPSGRSLEQLRFAWTDGFDFAEIGSKQIKKEGVRNQRIVLEALGSGGNQAQ
jgi:Asp-tRNA(Asn)/Glu-tRNA(Gln) amidotransferase A subunit family amidase